MTRDEIIELVELLRWQAVDARDPDALLEAELLEALLLGWESVAREATDAIGVRYLAAGGGGVVTEAEILTLLAAIAFTLGATLAARVEARMLEVARTGYQDAAGRLAGRPSRLPQRTGRIPVRRALSGAAAVRTAATFVFGLVDERAVEQVGTHGVYWVRTYYDRLLSDRLERLSRQVLTERLTRRAAGELFRDELGSLYGQGMTYWRGLATHVVTRTRELGRLAGYERLGTEYGYVSAVRDRRTSDVCTYLDGRRFRVADMLGWRDRLLAADSPEAVKEVQPWRTHDETVALVEANGGDIPASVGLPPYHFHCRTRSVVWAPGAPASSSTTAAA